MSHTKLLICIFAMLLFAGGAAYAQTTGYTLPWWTVDGGGGDSSGNGYILSGTIGQPDAGTLSGGGYTLAGGYWGGGSLPSETPIAIYLPIVVR